MKRRIPGAETVNRPRFTRRDRTAVRALLRGERPFGQDVKAFEEELSRYLGRPWVETTVNATMAYFMILKALGIGPGDQVLVPAYTFISAANVPLFLGAEPLFGDIAPGLPCLDPEEVIRKWTPRVKAVLFVSSFGHDRGLDEILSFCRSKRIPLIHDAAASFGSMRPDGPLAATGDYGFTSFHFKKTVSAFEGGALWGSGTPVPFQLLKNHGKQKTFEEAGLNLRLSDLHAVLGRSQLASLPRRLVIRERIASWYEEELGKIPQVSLPRFSEGLRPAWHQMIIRAEEKDSLKKFLAQKGIPAADPAQYIPSFPLLRKEGVSAPRALDYHSRALALPFYEGLSRRRVRRIAGLIRSFFSS